MRFRGIDCQKGGHLLPAIQEGFEQVPYGV
jgi:hypothetical protein